MTNLVKLEFTTIHINGNNDLHEFFYAEMYLDTLNLEDTIKERNATTNQEKAKAMILLHYHIHEDLKLKYLTIKHPHMSWSKFKERCGH